MEPRATWGTRRATPVLVGCAAVTLVVVCQWLTITYNREGNWTALFCTGTERALPPVVQGESIYRFLGTGFDGQYYHLIAHDPWFQRGMAAYVDDARLRYRRILVPATAHVLAMGDDRYVDSAYIAVILVWIGLGAYWCSQLAVSRRRHPAWGLAFLAIPAVIASADRLTADVALLALCAAFALHQANTRALLVLCMLAPLVRETGILLPAAVTLHALLSRHGRRAAAFCAAGLPFAAWAAFVAQRTERSTYPMASAPLGGILEALAIPRPYLDKPAIIAHLDQIADATALVGLLIALGLATLWIRRDVSVVGTAGLLFASMGIVIQRPDHFHHVFDFGRVYSPLFLFLLLDAKKGWSPAAAAPTLLTYPRIALQLGSQFTGVVVGLLHSLRVF